MIMLVKVAPQQHLVLPVVENSKLCLFEGKAMAALQNLHLSQGISSIIPELWK